jgi:hypothetical protein
MRKLNKLNQLKIWAWRTNGLAEEMDKLNNLGQLKSWTI